MRAIYLALATWAFAESMRLLITVEYQITRGDLGLRTVLFFDTPRSTPYFYSLPGLDPGRHPGGAGLVRSHWHLHARHPR